MKKLMVVCVFAAALGLAGCNNQMGVMQGPRSQAQAAEGLPPPPPPTPPLPGGG